jgi:hypothetical protein
MRRQGVTLSFLEEEKTDKIKRALTEQSLTGSHDSGIEGCEN